MAKRNRAREMQRYGSLQDGYRAPEVVRVPVSDEDKTLLGGLALWAHAYVNHVYKHAGHNGTEQPKRYTEPLWWRYYAIGERATILRFPLTVSAGERSIPYPGGGIDSSVYDEYRRQLKDSVDLHITAQEYPQNAMRSTSDDLRLSIDADGAIVSGRYYWIGDEGQERPAPDASFSSLETAHDATVSKRAADLLGRFRRLVLQPPDTLRIDGAWGRELSVRPPAELVAIPSYKN